MPIILRFLVDTRQNGATECRHVAIIISIIPTFPCRSIQLLSYAFARTRITDKKSLKRETAR